MSKILKTLKSMPQPVIAEGLTAAEVRQAHLNHAKTYGSKEMQITGRTFPMRKFIWVHGGRWDKEAKVQMVPLHVWIKVQDAVNTITAKIDENIKAREDAKAVAV